MIDRTGSTLHAKDSATPTPPSAGSCNESIPTASINPETPTFPFNPRALYLKPHKEPPILPRTQPCDATLGLTRCACANVLTKELVETADHPISHRQDRLEPRGRQTCQTCSKAGARLLSGNPVYFIGKKMSSRRDHFPCLPFCIRADSCRHATKGYFISTPLSLLALLIETLPIQPPHKLHIWLIHKPPKQILSLQAGYVQSQKPKGPDKQDAPNNQLHLVHPQHSNGADNGQPELIIKGPCTRQCPNSINSRY